MYYLWFNESNTESSVFILDESTDTYKSDANMEKNFPGWQKARGGNYVKLSYNRIEDIWTAYQTLIGHSLPYPKYAVMNYFNFIDVNGKLYPQRATIEGTPAVPAVKEPEIVTTKDSTLYEMARADLRKRIRQEEEQRPKEAAFEFL